MYWILTNTVNDNQVNRFHFQLSRWDTKYKERSHILSEYLLLDNVKLIPSRLLKDFTYELNISSSPPAKPPPPRPSLQHKTECDWGSFNTIWYLNLIISDPPCPGSLSLPDTVLVLFAETCFYGGGDCGESNTGHRQRGNQPHGTHIPVSTSWPVSCSAATLRLQSDSASQPAGGNILQISSWTSLLIFTN